MKNETFNNNFIINLRMNMIMIITIILNFKNVHLDFRICENSSKNGEEGVGNCVAQEAKPNRGHTGKMFGWLKWWTMAW